MLYCRMCGKELPAGSRFCLHCGAPIDGTPPARVEWEHSEFRYDMPDPWAGAIRISGMGAWTLPAIQLHWWNHMQGELLPLLNKWTDKGWEAETEIGPGAFEVRITLHGCFPFLWILYGGARYAEPVCFRVRMRRPKR